MRVTQEDLLDALRAALGPRADDTCHTVQEIAGSTGWGETKVRKVLSRLMREGRLEVRSVHRPAIDGRQASVPAYKLRAA